LSDENEFALDVRSKKENDAITATIEAKPMAIMRAFAEKYSLTLEVGDVMLLHGKPYITKSGLLRLSHAQKIKAVIPKRVDVNYQEGYAHYECTVTTHDDRVYKDEGFCGKEEKGKYLMKDIIGTAITRARNRALGAATSIPYCTTEEIDMDTQRKMVDVVEAAHKGKEAA
jgi:hypothetical protein